MADPLGQPTAASTLLGTKLYIPKRRPTVVARPGLIERLDRGAERKLTLVSAPAGFGKTTLLADWVRRTAAGERPAAWLSLDPGDNRLELFYTYVITALRAVRPEVGDSALSLLRSRQPPPIDSQADPTMHQHPEGTHPSSTATGTSSRPSRGGCSRSILEVDRRSPALVGTNRVARGNDREVENSTDNGCRRVERAAHVLAPTAAPAQDGTPIPSGGSTVAARHDGLAGVWHAHRHASAAEPFASAESVQQRA
jgi:hypothetical protein